MIRLSQEALLNGKDKIMVSAVVVSNNPDNLKNLISTLKNYSGEIVAVVDASSKFKDLVFVDNVKIIPSVSHNFAYLRNIGTYFAKGSYVFRCDDDEDFSEDLLRSLKEIKYGPEAYLVTVDATFTGITLNMWRRIIPKLTRKELTHFISQIHEYLPVKFQGGVKLPGNASNNSYTSWKHYWSKVLRFTSYESKVFKTFIFRLLFPVYNYFDKEGYKDRILGLEVLMASIIYAFLMLVRGTRYKEIKWISIREEVRGQLDRTSDSHEKEYLTYLVNRMDKNIIPEGSTETEECLQIMSGLRF